MLNHELPSLFLVSITFLKTTTISEQGLEVQKYKFTCHLFRYVLNETAKKDKNKNSGKKADANFNESMAEQKINWIGKLEPNSEEALTMFEALKKDEIANQAQLRLARISGM